MAVNTDNRLTRLLMLEAAPYSSVKVLFILETISLGGIRRVIILVPSPSMVESEVRSRLKRIFSIGSIFMSFQDEKNITVFLHEVTTPFVSYTNIEDVLKIERTK